MKEVCLLLEKEKYFDNKIPETELVLLTYQL